MTKKENNFIDDQLHIIKNKIDEDALNRYAALLSVADLRKEVKAYLKRACDMKRGEFKRISPMAVNGDIDDIN